MICQAPQALGGDPPIHPSRCSRVFELDFFFFGYTGAQRRGRRRVMVATWCTVGGLMLVLASNHPSSGGAPALTATQRSRRFKPERVARRSDQASCATDPTPRRSRASAKGSARRRFPLSAARPRSRSGGSCPVLFTAWATTASYPPVARSREVRRRMIGSSRSARASLAAPPTNREAEPG